MPETAPTHVRATAASVQAREPAAQCHSGTRWAKRFGAFAFLFFLIKGLAWLVVPAALAAWAAM